MAKLDLASSEWCQLIFEGKNQAYGAYRLRANSTKRHNVAMLIVVIIAAVGFSIPTLLKLATPEQKEVMTEVTTLSKLEEPEIKQEEIADDIYSMWLHTEQIAAHAKAGQFVSVYCKEGSRLLPRPISICEIDRKDGALRLVYRVAGKGTEEFSSMHTGMQLKVIGPLGNGFPKQEKKAFLIGGGIGIPPMLELAKELNCEKQIVLGYRDELFLLDEFRKQGEVYIATEDGSVGTEGNVLDAIRENGLTADVIYACGPLPMLRALKEYAAKEDIECWISMEERMACGIGACLACVCKSTEKDAHSNVKNKRVCKEGPVFRAEEVDF